MAPDAGKYLWDALQAASRVQRFAGGKTFDDYLADEVLRSAVERQLEIVGEALSSFARPIRSWRLPYPISLRRSLCATC